MITLKYWFNKNANRPLAIATILIVLVWGVLLAGFLNEAAVHREEGTKQLANLLSLSFSQKNRVLTESLLASSHESLVADSAVICEKDTALISSNAGNRDCGEQGTWLHPRIVHPVPGSENYRLVVAFSLFRDRTAVWIFLLIGLAFVGTSFWLLRSIRHRLQTDIFGPLEVGLLSDAPMPIAELEQVRKKKKIIEESRGREAVLQAVLENKNKVAHNIKSPLRTLRLVQESVRGVISERDSKLLDGVIESINKILGDQQSPAVSVEQRSTHPVKPAAQTREAVLLSDFLDETLTQKSTEFSGLKNISILMSQSDDLFGTFANVVKHEFRAILSNLINNAVDAIGTGKGSVVISARRSGDFVLIRVADGGCGIPEEHREKIFEKGVTFKKGGTGFGLYHARQYLKEWGGTIELMANTKHGACFEIRLPLAKAPEWFADRVDLSGKKNIVIVDDDALIYKVWKDRLSEIEIPNTVKVRFAANEAEFDSAIGEIASEISESIILCDFDLSHPTMTGLDMVQSYGVSAITTLVTNNFQSADVIERCGKEKMKILPKPCIHAVPISV